VRWPWQKPGVTPGAKAVPREEPAPPPDPGSPSDCYPHRTYGGNDTIRRTGILDVETDPANGKVTSVWFRCLNLPFQVFERPNTARINPEGMFIEEITYRETS
jgi:hypothetical protein